MPTTPHTSYRLSQEAKELLNRLATKWGHISSRAVLEIIIRRAAAEEGITLSEDKPGQQ